jgi:hypothetical protein
MTSQEVQAKFTQQLLQSLKAATLLLEILLDKLEFLILVRIS